MKDDREWIQEHTGPNYSIPQEEKGVWHWYGCGHWAYSSCGRRPIPGSPYVYKTIPDWDDAIVCGKCVENWNMYQY